MRSRASCVVRQRRLRAASCGLRQFITALLALAALVVPVRAVAQASPYVPLDDPAYGIIDALMARGGLRTLSYLDRPYTVAAIERALASSATASRGTTEAWKTALGRAVRKYDRADSASATGRPAATMAFGVELFGTLQTSARRELMLADTVNGAMPGIGGHFLMRVDHFVAASHVIGDRRLKKDPEYAGKTDRPLTGRTEDAYLSAQSKYGELFVGRLARNWGPPPLNGLQLGHYSYTYDHLFARLGVPAANLSFLTARLDDRPRAAGELPDQRYLATHRLAIRAGRLEISGGEAIIYGGQGRGFEPAMANPLAPVVLGQFNEFRNGNDGNINYAADVAWRSERSGVWSFSAFLDDLQVDRCKDLCQEPASYAFSLAAEGLPFVRDHRVFASYRRVTNLTYRTSDPALSYTFAGVGLGDGFSDYDELRAGLDLALLPMATLRVYGAFRRQGQGDYRAPFPTPAEYATTPGFLSGTVTHISRIGVCSAGSYGIADFSADLGINRVTSDATDDRTNFEGRVRVSIRPRWLLARSIPVPE